MDQAVLGALARHVLNAAGAALVTKGVIASAMVEPVTGAVLVLASFIWSVIQKKRAK